MQKGLKKSRVRCNMPAPRVRLSAEDRKTQIVDVALKLFSKKGLKGTTTREIAEAASISEATIFRHFKNKEALYRAIINRCCNDPSGESMLLKRLAHREGRAFFLEISRFMLERTSKDPSLARLLMFSALEEKSFSDIFMRSKGMELVCTVTDHIRTLIKRGEFKRRDPELSARAFIGMVLHYCIVQEIYGVKRFFNPPAGVVADTFVDIFLEGMKKGEGK